MKLAKLNELKTQKNEILKKDLNYFYNFTIFETVFIAAVNF